jgi:hypothetical protein
MDESDPSRAVEFLTFILDKQRKVLLDADSGSDLAMLFRGLRPEKVAPTGQLQFAVAVVDRVRLRSTACRTN